VTEQFVFWLITLVYRAYCSFSSLPRLWTFRFGTVNSESCRQFVGGVSQLRTTMDE